MKRLRMLTVAISVVPCHLGLLAQEPPSLPRKVIHLWVDPHYGNDNDPVASASVLNPVAPLQPVDVLKPGADVLFHKPWPFKTITAAVNAIPALPYSGQHAVWEFAIIHLLPGLYKRNTGVGGAPTPVAYLDNGLRGNGESLPIYLPAGVSVQGTSALNTMINVEDIGPAFEFGTAGAPLATGVNTFISGVSIYGADAGNANHKANCAVYIGQDFPASPTFSNCFIFGNGIGVAVDAPDDSTPQEGYHTPRLINNTLAWNACGVWNGQRTRPQGSVGVSRLVLVNNIFDASPPYAWTAANFPGDGPPVNWNMLGISGFEGVDDNDLFAFGLVTGDFNAYERAENGTLKANRQVVVAGGFPVTALRTNLVVGPQPGRNLAPFTGWNGTSNIARGVLYIRDALHNALRLGGGAPTQFARPGTLNQCDLSPGDFRLCPNVALAGVDGQGRPFAPGSAQGALNPLVDAGFYAAIARDATGPVFSMANGVQFGVPGRLPTAAWQFDNWDQDCEGFGNPRCVDHPVYPDANPGAQSPIDVGADEMGELIAVAYRFGTTHFVDGQPPVHASNLSHLPLVNDNRYLMWFGPAAPRNTAPAPTTPGRPRYTYPWPDAWSFDLVAGRPSYYWPGKTDVIPHLLPDLHPWWYLLGGFNIPTNCIWHHWSGLHNAWLFVPPIAAVINPPGTSNVLVAGYAWLDFTLNPAPMVFGPFGVPNPINEFGAWCEAHDRLNVALPHWDDLQGILPPANQAVRYSLELPAPTFYSATPANLQSFMLLRVQ